MVSWERLLFAPVNPTAAAIFRVALAGVLALAFWPSGLRPGDQVAWLPELVSLYERVFLTPSCWLVVLAGLILLGAGWRPRALGLLLFALLSPLALLQEGQQSRQVLLVALLAFSLVRSDARYSLRAWSGGAPAPTAGPIWPIRLIQLQLSALYALNALAKSSPAYLSGEVLVGMSLMLPNVRLDFSDRVHELGPLVLPVWLLVSASTVVEWTLAVGLWFRRLRLGVALLGVAFHLICRFVITIFLLDLASVFLYLAFLLPFDRLGAPDERPVGAGETSIPRGELQPTERAAASAAR